MDIGYESKKETYDETQRVLAEKRRTKPQPDSASRYAAAAKAITDMPSEASGFFYRRPIRHLTTINGVPAHVMDARYRARMAATGSVGSAIVGGRDDWQERKAQSGGGGDRGSFQGGGRGGYHAGAGGSGRGGHADGGTSGPGGEQQQQVQFSNFQRRFHTNDNLQQPRPKYYKRRQ